MAIPLAGPVQTTATIVPPETEWVSTGSEPKPTAHWCEECGVQPAITVDGNGTWLCGYCARGLPDTFRHAGPRVGRNDPCSCGSGKKHKACCLGKRQSK